jgi:hypothetical protein
MRISSIALGCVALAAIPTSASAKCHFDFMRFRFAGESSTSNASASSGQACGVRLTGQRMSGIDIGQQPAHGSVTSTGSSGDYRVTYTSKAGYKGPDSFSFVVHGIFFRNNLPGITTQTINVDVQ